MTTLQINVDEEIKEKANTLFRELGTTTSAAVNMFLRQSLIQRGLPFQVRLGNQPNIETAIALDNVLNGKNLSAKFTNVDEMMTDLLDNQSDE
jgi:DNA-damage-inducible protein J